LGRRGGASAGGASSAGASAGLGRSFFGASSGGGGAFFGGASAAGFFFSAAGAGAPPPAAAFARPCSSAFVFSGSSPATILSGLTCSGPVAAVTAPMTFVKYATWLGSYLLVHTRRNAASSTHTRKWATLDSLSLKFAESMSKSVRMSDDGKPWSTQGVTLPPGAAAIQTLTRKHVARLCPRRLAQVMKTDAFSRTTYRDALDF